MKTGKKKFLNGIFNGGIGFLSAITIVALILMFVNPFLGKL